MSDGGPGSIAEEVTPAESLTDLVDNYRRTRGELERNVLPLATSVDGRQFTFQASLYELEFQTGGYVVLEGEDGHRRLGQVLTMRPESELASEVGLEGLNTSMQVRLARGEGVILDGDLRPFHDAMARPAEPGEVSAWLERVRPNRSLLEIGEMLLAPGVAAALDSGGFNRHTFMCGQSGSGKTYSLGLVLERLLLGTSLRMVILIPTPTTSVCQRSESLQTLRAPRSTPLRQAESRFGRTTLERHIRCSCNSLTSIRPHRPPCSGLIQSAIERSTPRCQGFLLRAKRAAV
jgi:hypothetical protein